MMFVLACVAYSAYKLWSLKNKLTPEDIIPNLKSSLLSAISLAATGCASCCSNLSWFIVGLVWRFSTSGRFASGKLATEDMTEADLKIEISKDNNLY